MAVTCLTDQSQEHMTYEQYSRSGASEAFALGTRPSAICTEILARAFLVYTDPCISHCYKLICTSAI